MHPLNVEYMQAREYFNDALWIYEELNLSKLLTIKCDFNAQWILQFYATLVIKGDADKTMKWMTRTHMCTSNFVNFVRILGYTFYSNEDEAPHHIHSTLRPEKERLFDLYDENGVLGETKNLLPLYDLLVRMFRENIDPSGGNNDAIRDVLIELLGHAHDCYSCPDDTVNFKIDVMDFIYNEMYNAMIGRNTVPYAPYIMLLIKDTLRGTPGFDDMSDDCEEHKVKKPYIISKTATAPRAPPSHGSFMGDARRHDPPSTKEAKKASRLITKEVKKLSWFQKHVLCMNVEIHKENYQGYRERKEIMDTQRLILHKLSGDQGDAPVPSAPIEYKQWNNSRFDWSSFGKQLWQTSDSPPQANDDGDQEEDDSDYDDGGDASD
jgi:hypothetical protein